MLRSSLGHNNAVVRCWLSRGGGHLARLFMGPVTGCVSAVANMHFVLQPNDFEVDSVVHCRLSSDCPKNGNR